MATIQVVAKRFGIIEGQLDVHEPVAFVLSELKPASFARALLGHHCSCSFMSSSRPGATVSEGKVLVSLAASSLVDDQG